MSAQVSLVDQVSEKDPDAARPNLRVVPQQQSRPPRVCVIGGGIAGLAAAQAVVSADSRAEVTVLEADNKIGGKLQLGSIAGIDIDEGAEAMQAARPEAVSLAKSVGLGRDLVRPEIFGASLWSRNKLRPMPPTLMGIPTDLRALTSSGVLPLRTVLGLPREYHRKATRFDGDVSVGAFVESRLGRDVVDTLVEPVLGGVYAGRADALSMEATVPALFREMRSHRSLLKAAEYTARGGGRRAGARQGPVFMGIRGGVGRLPLAIASYLQAQGASVRTRWAARSMHRVDNTWRILVDTPEGQDVLTAEHVIVALPPRNASDLLDHICPPAATDLGLMGMSSMAIVAAAYPADAVKPLTGSGFLVPPGEGRVVKAANYASSKWDWVSRQARTRRGEADSRVVIRASVGRLGDEEVLNRTDSELILDVHNDLADAIGISRPPTDYQVTRWNDAIPQYETGHVRRVERIRSAIAGVPGLEICGAAFDGVGVAAVIGSARYAARGTIEMLNAQAVG